jgi:hypothetical protein
MLLDKYIKNAILNGDCTERGDYKKVNESYHKIESLYKKMKEVDSDLTFLRPLLKYDNGSVRLWSATYLLPLRTKEAEKVLEELSKKNGFVAFDAKMTLQEWKKGNLKF